MDRAEIDISGNGTKFFGKAEIISCKKVEGQDNVFHLVTEHILERSAQVSAKPGQFYLLRAVPSSVQLDRPISVYSCSEKLLEDGKRKVRVEFLILKKGIGTQELCSLKAGNKCELIGPLGNTFNEFYNSEKEKICIIGGGIGVAPVANFASSLKAKSYDFYASFKSGFYGTENIKAQNLFITTDDGSFGIHGMLSAAIDAEKLIGRKYSAVYACGPLPMLRYIKEICQKANIPCYISMENKMACGVGACLCCTIFTSQGNKRVCKDGPVFNADIISFEPFVNDAVKPAQKRSALLSDEEVNLEVEICGIKFKNPVIAASGTFAYGQNYRDYFDVNKLGGICSKGLTLEARKGNPGERVVETAGGHINSIGLENPGTAEFIKSYLPQMLKLNTVTIANLAGGSIDSYVEAASLLDKTEVPMIELNISCPNVKAGAMAFGMHPDAAFEVVSAVKKVLHKPLMVKLTPNAPDVVEIALACINAGCDAISLVNTFQALAIDVEKGTPVFANIKAGLCGPAIKPIALRMVYDVVNAINKLPLEKRVPVIGLGGISNWKDAAEFIMAGASAVEVGSATFSNPLAMVEIIDDLKKFMKRKGYKSISDFRGIAQR